MVTSIRSFSATLIELGVGEDDGTFYIYDRAIGASSWHRHVGEFPTFDAAAAWINAIKELV